MTTGEQIVHEHYLHESAGKATAESLARHIDNAIREAVAAQRERDAKLIESRMWRDGSRQKPFTERDLTLELLAHDIRKGE